MRRAQLRACAGVLDKELPEGPGPDLDLPLFARTLYLQIAALAAVRGKVLDRAELLLDATIEHERRFWTREIAALGRREPALDATQEAVDIRRRLAAERPDAFLHDLANSLNNLGRRLSEMERDDEALAAAHEAVIILVLFFLALPAAHGRRMRWIVDTYVERAAKVGQDPDSDLIDPIRQALEQLG